VTAGAIGSSDRLIKDTRVLATFLLRAARQVLAVEMESAGVYRAASGRGVPCLAIRGLSDVVGFKRDPGWTAYACHSAAAFTLAFLRTRPIAPTPAAQGGRGARAQPRGRRPRERARRIVHPLQPATFFSGRAEVLSDLTKWIDDVTSTTRVVSLIGIGGCGKTALLQRVVAHAESEPHAGGLLVWSFYEDPKTEAFLREACAHFGDGDAGDTAGLRFRLTTALASGAEQLIVLDGIEMVQSEGGGGRPRGSLDDHSMKVLLRSIAAGLGRTRCILTSRLPLADLQNWKDSGYREVRLHDLSDAAAAALLRAWGVRGSEAELQGLAGHVGRHALSVSVLGAYITEFCGGDPRRAADLELDQAAQDDPQAAKLARVLAGYARALPETDRDVLARLSAFPRGIEIERFPAGAGGDHILFGAASGDVATTRKALERLSRRGLVFRYRTQGREFFTAHPFLRDYFKSLLGFPPEALHEQARNRILAQLEARPIGDPSRDVRALDAYELLIEHTLLAGRVDRAWWLYASTLGGYATLGGRHGEFARGVRILAGFATDADPERLRLEDGRRRRALLDWASFAEALGELETARRCYRILGDSGPLHPHILRSWAFLEMQRGDLPEAARLATRALDASTTLGDEEDGHAQLGVVLDRLGEADRAQAHFSESSSVRDTRLWHPNMVRYSLWRIESRTSVGGDVGLEAFLSSRVYERIGGWTDNLARIHLLEARRCLQSDAPEARRLLETTREWIARTDHVEITIRCHLLGAAIELHAGNVGGALSEATRSLDLAEACGFGVLAQEALLAVGRGHLAVGRHGDAARAAEAALAAATDVACGYAWGRVSALCLLGEVRVAEGRTELARTLLEEARRLQVAMHDPGAAATAELLRRCE
jgi:tetratricopeptide (TPR) repeat protein